MSNRKNDTRGEKALGLFLDRYFYPRFCELEGFTGIQRIYETELQKAGVDIILSNSAGATLTIDEKAQLHYINKPRSTFAFEISFYSEKTMTISDGWFISDSSKTDCYVLVWIDSARTDLLNRIVEEDFNEVTIFFVTKKRIMQYLAKLGYSTERIKTIANGLRNDDNDDPFELSPDSFIYYSKDYDEKPINVVISRSVLDQMAYCAYKVTRIGCEKLPK